MQIHRDLSGIPVIRNPVVTTGSFDGVHIGHQQLFSRIRNLARGYDGESVVITFDPHPREVVFPQDDTLRLLTSIHEKTAYFEQYGIDHTVIIPFTVEFSQMSPREYIEKFLIGTFNLKCLVIGYDHRFGLNRAGDISLLEEYASRNAFDVISIDKQEVDNITVSSTKIRNAIAAGEIEKANKLLGHPYGIRGKVVRGENLGEKLGFPTANIQPDTKKKLLPPSGIYACYATVDEIQYKGMLYIGSKPTVSQNDKALSIEVHLMEFEGNLYNNTVEVEVISRLRDDKQYENLEQLKLAIAQDRKTAEAVLDSIENITLANTAVVALNYNGMGVVDQCFPSWPNAISKSADIYCIDNASTDGSKDYIRNYYSRFKIIELAENHGFAGGYNRGLQDLDHKYFALVNSDVELTEGWLVPILELMDANPDVAVCQPKILDYNKRSHFEYAGGCGGFIDALGIPFCAGRVLHTIEEDQGQYDHISEIFWASGAAFVIRADLFRDMGGFDEDFFAHMEEIDLCWRLKRAGYRIMSVPQSVVYHIGGGTLSYDNPKKVYLNFRNNLSTIIKNARLKRLFWLIPARLVLDAVAMLHFVFRGQLPQAVAVIHAYLSLVIRVPSLVSKRRRVNRIVRVHKRAPYNTYGILGRSILFQYYLRLRHTFSSLNWQPDAV